MAKFSKGDKVKWLEANDAGLPTGSVVTIRGIENGKYVVYAGMKKNLIDEKELREEHWPAPNSCRNSVVANALAWKNEKTACNANLTPEAQKLYKRLNHLAGNDLMGHYWDEREQIVKKLESMGYKVKERYIGPHTLTDEYYSISNSTHSDGEVVENADDYKKLSEEAKKVWSHLKSANDILVMNMMKMTSEAELASIEREALKAIANAIAAIKYIKQYAE